MALSIITGSLATHDVTMGGSSVKCGFGRMAMQIVRSATRSTTFCSSGFVEEIPGEKQGVGSLLGYVVKGVAWADPLVWVNASAPVAMVMTADAGPCTLSANVNVFSDGIDLVAAANSGRNVDFRTTGPVTSAWIVA